LKTTSLKTWHIFIGQTRRFPFSLFPACFISFACPLPSPHATAAAASLLGPLLPLARRRTKRRHCGLVAALSPDNYWPATEGYFLYYYF
jgi:hypothetical protein